MPRELRFQEIHAELYVSRGEIVVMDSARIILDRLRAMLAKRSPNGQFTERVMKSSEYEDGMVYKMSATCQATAVSELGAACRR